MPEDYITKVYAGMNSAYASTGFKLSEQEFRAKLSSDPSYASKVYSGMNSAYASTGFKLSEDEFSGRLGAVPKKKVPTQPIQAAGTAPSPVASTGGELPSTPGVQLDQGSGTSSYSETQAVMNLLDATGKGFSGERAKAPVSIYGGAAGSGQVTDASGITSNNPRTPIGVRDFGQSNINAPSSAYQTPQDIAYNQRSIEEARDRVIELNNLRDGQLSQIPAGDTKNTAEANDFWDAKIKKEQETINLGVENSKTLKLDLAGADPNAVKETSEELIVNWLPQGSQARSVPLHDPETGALITDPENYKEKTTDWEKAFISTQLKNLDNLIEKDLNRWSRYQGGEMTESELNDMKSVQKFASDLVNNESLSNYQKSQSIRGELNRLQSKMRESAVDKELNAEAAAQNKDVSDVMYDKKKRFMDDNPYTQYLPEDMKGLTDDIWKQTSGMRDFMEEYYDPTGKKGFTMVNGELDMSGIVDPKKREFIESSAKDYMGLYRNIMTVKYSEYEGGIYEKRRLARDLDSKIDNAKKQISTLPEGSSERAKYQSIINSSVKTRDGIRSEIAEKEKWRSSVFLTEPEKLVDGVSGEMNDSASARAAFGSKVAGESPLRSFEKSFLKLKEATDDMRLSGDFDASYLDRQGQRAREWVDLESLGLNLSGKEKEYLANRRILTALSPIFLNNNLGLTGESGDFLESFRNGMSSFLTPESSETSTETKIAGDQLQYLSKEGFQAESFNDEKIFNKIEKRLDVPWNSMESAGEISGVVSAVILDLAVSNAVIVNPTLSAASKFKKIVALGKVYDTAIDATRVGRFLKPLISESVKGEIAGSVIGSSEEELNFTSFFIGGGVGKVMQKTLSKLPPKQLKTWVVGVFGGKGEEAINLISKIGNANSRGLGEVAEEFTQELVQVYNLELGERGFWEEVENRFGTFNGNMKFVISSYMMGAAFSFTGSKEAKESYDKLSEEEKKIVDSVKAEVAGDISSSSEKVVEEANKESVKTNAVRNTTPKVQLLETLKEDLKFEQESEFGGDQEMITKLESQIAETETSIKEEAVTEESITEEVDSPMSELENVDIVEESGLDVEYKIDDKFQSEEEFIEKLSDPKVTEDIKSGRVKVDIQNPSAAVTELLTPKNKVNEKATTETVEAETTAKTEVKPKNEGVLTETKESSKVLKESKEIENELADLEMKLSQTETSSSDTDFIPEVIVAKNLPKITSESAMDATGGKTGANQDIAIGLINDTDGMSVDDAAHQLWQDHFQEDGIYDTQDVREMITDILKKGKVDYLNEYTKAKETADIKREIRSVKKNLSDAKKSEKAADKFYGSKAVTEFEVAEMTPEAFDQSDADFIKDINNLTDEEIEAEFEGYEYKGDATESTSEGKSEDTGNQKKDAKGKSEQPSPVKEPIGGPEKVSKQTKRAADLESDPEVKKKLESIGKYKTETFEQVSRYVDDLVAALGPKGAIAYVSDPSSKVDEGLRVAVQTEAGAMLVEEGRNDLRKAEKANDSEAEYAANEKMYAGYDAINQASQAKTKAGQIIAYTRNSYKKYPSVFLLETMNRFEGSNKGVLDKEYSTDSEGNSVTAREEINNLKDDIGNQIDEVVSKKMDELLDRIKGAEDQNKALSEEIEKLKKDRDKKLGTKKERVQKAKKKFDDAFTKLKNSKPGKGSTSSTLLLLNNEQIGAILEMISAVLEMGGHSASQLVTKVYNAAKDATGEKSLTKDHIRNMAVQIDEYNAMVQGEIESGSKTAKEILSGEDLKKVVRDHYNGRNAYARTLAQAIMRNTDLDADSAQAIALSIETELKEEIDQLVEKELRKMLMNDRESMADLKKAKKDGIITENQEAELERRIKSKENSTVKKKLIDAVNMGALGRSTDFQRAFEGKFGFKILPDAVRNRLNVIAEKLSILENDIQQDIMDDQGNVIDQISTRHVERIGVMQREFNTLLESQRKVNLAIAIKEIVALQYILMLSGVKTFARAFTGGYTSGVFGTLAYNISNLNHPKALLVGYVAAAKSVPAAWSRARTSRKTGYDFFGENAMKGDYNSSSQSRTEKMLLSGLGDAVNSGNVPKIIGKAITQTLKVIHAIGALDAFQNTVGGNFIGSVEKAKADMRVKNKTGSMSDTVSSLLANKKIKDAAYESIAAEEYSNIKSDIATEVDVAIKNKELSPEKRDAEIKRRLKKEMGITGSIVSPEGTYKKRRIQELRESDLGEYFQQGISLAKDSSLMGKPDGVAGYGAEKLQQGMNIKYDDSSPTLIWKGILNALFKFVRMTVAVTNKSANNIPILGIANATFGRGWDPIKEEWVSSLKGGKRKANPLLMKQRIAVNVLVTGIILGVMTEMFDFGDDDDESGEKLKNLFLLNTKKWKLDPNRSIDIRGFGFGGMGGGIKNEKFHAGWENISFSITKDENGRFTDYMTVRLSPELSAVAATVGAFTDDFKGDADRDDVWKRMDMSVLSYSSRILSNNMKIFTESSFSSIGRMSKNFTMKDEVTDGILATVRGLGLDNTRPLINPAAFSSITKYIQASQGVNEKDPDSFMGDLLKGAYGLDYFVKKEKTDLFGNPYPVENDIDSFFSNIKEKRTEKFDKTVGLLYKFPQGVDISKWNTNGYEYGGTFKVKGERGKEFRSVDNAVADEIILIQEEDFRKRVLDRYQQLNSEDSREELTKELKKLQTKSKDYAEQQILEKYFNERNPSKGKVVLVGN
jgi:hypothetical protein